ncbi:MOP flippase family protein [Bacillus sp. FSL W8-1127]|jgi:PST family polysaccharide transporter/lipopolysaccharide exporter|uniref:MOP flippase family protein n=1 Tax=Bacillus TaxID=1386 RepID=UPI002E1A33EE|nr:MOP flippase family protein [Bacillus smithii]MED1420913.1 MOP flippase family protein [Bacillus smithii]MED1455727.1 MOP flippase family protein [Bacillus smithii]
MSLKQKAIQGVKWTTVSTVITILLQLLQLVVLGRLLDSSAFGLMGMVLVIVGFADLFMDMGISNAIIQRQDISKKELSSLYWLNVISGAFIAVLIWCFSPVIADLFKEPKMSDLVKWIAVIYLITPLGQQYRALLQKELRFNLIAKAEVLSAVLGVGLSIVAAYYGQGVMSLIWGQLVIALVKTVIFIGSGMKYHKPGLHFRFSETKRFLSFGIYQMGESVLNYFNSKVDSVIIGRTLGSVALGYYTMPFNIIIMPSTKINPILTRVLFPLFSKMQDNQERLKQNFFKLLTLVSLVNFPIFFGLFVTAPLFIPVIFGDKWMNSIHLLQLLCGVGLLRSVGNPIGSLLMATGQVNISFRFNAFKMFTQIPGIIIGAYAGGLTGVAVAYLILQVFYTILSYRYMIYRAVGPSLSAYIQSFIPGTVASAIMGIVVWLIGRVLTPLSDVYQLAVEIIVGIVTYIVMMMFSRNEVAVELKQMVGKKLGFAKSIKMSKAN